MSADSGEMVHEASGDGPCSTDGHDNWDTSPENAADAVGLRSVGAVSNYGLQDRACLVECGDARIRITSESEGVVRVRFAPNGAFRRDHSWSVIAGADEGRPFRMAEDPNCLRLETADLIVRVQRAPCRIGFETTGGEVLAADDCDRGMAWCGSAVQCWKTLRPEDHFFGLGERTGPLDKAGQVVVNWNHDAADHHTWTDPLYQSHPFVMVLNRGRAYGIFFDNTFRTFFDLGKTSPSVYAFGAAGGEMNYYFIVGPAPKDVLRRYAKLVGATPLPPRWALGYQQCRWSYDTARRVRQIAGRLRERKIPCDTVYLDIDYMDEYRCFTWHPKRFPHPNRLVEDLARQGFKTAVIIDPGIRREPGYSVYDAGLRENHFCRDADGNHYAGKVWPGETVYPDYTRPDTRRWWGGLYQGLIETGVAGFWNDMNEPSDFTFAHRTVPATLRHDNDGAPTDHREVHNVYGMQMARATFEGLRRLRPESRPFVLTRAGYAGVQRYAAVWTGDNLASWEHLRMSIPMLLNMSLSGITFCGADIGGFRGAPTAELYTRWLQLGIFYPLCRTHTAGGRQQDPTAFGRRHERINRRAIELRYRLLPYIYTQFHESAETGLPLLRPLLLECPDLPEVHTCEHEFMFGSQLLAAPVIEAGAKTRTFRLPPGRWYGFENATTHEGDGRHEVAVDLDSIPLFAGSGAIIPMRDVVQHVDEKPLEELILRIFPGSGTGAFYNDVGTSYDYEDGAFLYERYETIASDGGVKFRLTTRTGSDHFAPKSYWLMFEGCSASPWTVSTSGRPLHQCQSRQALATNRSGWCFDGTSQTLMLRLPRLAPGAEIDVRLSD